METPAAELSRPLTFFEKLRIGIACAIAILLLWTLGWRMAAPVDPEMAVTFTHSGRAVFATWPTLAILTVIAAAIGTAIVGRRAPEAGALAAAVGLAAMSLRGGTMQELLGYYADGAPGPRRSLMFYMLLDCVLWTGVMAAGWVAITAVRRWLWEDGQDVRPLPLPPGPNAKNVPPAPAASPDAASGKAGWAAFAITTVVGVIVIWATISRTPVANVAEKQVFASVCGGLFMGAMAARSLTRVLDATPYVLAAPAVGIIGLVLGYLGADMGWAEGTPYKPYAALATTPPHDLARALPVVYIAVGVIGAVLGYWAGDRVEHVTEEEPG